MKSILRSLAVIAAVALSCLTFSASTQAADYTYNVPLGTPMGETVHYSFSDNVRFTPTISGNYNVDFVAIQAKGGCSTRYCHSSWTIVTNISVATVNGVTMLPNGNVTMFMQAGTTYVINLQGSGAGTGTYAGWGQYNISIASQ